MSDDCALAAARGAEVLLQLVAVGIFVAGILACCIRVARSPSAGWNEATLNSARVGVAAALSLGIT